MSFGGAVLMFSLLACGPVMAGEFSVAPSFGTLGLGINAGYQVNDYFKARINANYLAYNQDVNTGDVDVDASWNCFTIGALADVHPFAGNFRLSAGLYYVNMILEGTGTLSPSKQYTIGNHTYTGRELGTWEGSVGWAKFAPYLGIGWGTGEGKKSGFSFHADIGALFIGDPSVTLTPSRQALAARPELVNDIRREENKTKDDVGGALGIMPVISLGFAYRF
jgi:hypothetical protein